MRKTVYPQIYPKKFTKQPKNVDMWDEQREIFDCLKRELDICVKNIVPSQNTAFMSTPVLNSLLDSLVDK